MTQDTSSPSGRPGRLQGLTAIVTGASRGIGRAIALAYVREGAQVALVATSAELLAETQQLCAAVTPEARTSVHVLDVADRKACFAMVEAVASSFGRIDVLLNGAGIYKARPFLEYDDEDFHRLLEVNLHGNVHLMQAVLPGMIARRSGSIVNIASTAGKWASIGQSAYNVSKHAVVGLTRCVAQEMGPHGVRVNAICPGLVQTDMLAQGFGIGATGASAPPDLVNHPIMQRIAMKRVLHVDEIAGLAVFLASAESSGMTGQSVLVDGGMLYV